MHKKRRKPLIAIMIILLAVLVPAVLIVSLGKGNNEDDTKKSQAILKQRIESSKDYLLRMMDPDLHGVHKYYYAEEDRFEDRLHTIYTASTLYTLLKVYDLTKDEELIRPIDEGSGFLLFMQNREGRYSGAFYYSYFPKTEKKEEHFVVGTTSKTIFTLLELHNRTGDKKYLESAISGANWLTTMVQEDGRVRPYVEYDNGKWVHSTRESLLYDGQVLSALSRMYRATGDKDYLDSAEKIAEHIFMKIGREGCYLGDDVSDNNPISSSWALLSMYDYYLASSDEKYKETVFRCAGELLSLQKDEGRWQDSLSTSGTGWLAEVFVTLYNFCIDEGRDECERYRTAVVSAINWSMARTYTAESNVKNPKMADGGIYWDDKTSYVRTDSVCHGLNAYVGIYDDIKEGELIDSSDAEKSEDQSNYIEMPDDPDAITLFVVGDMIFDRKIRKVVEEKGDKDYSYPFQRIKDLLSKPDLLIGNLESQISDKEGQKVEKTNLTVHFKADPNAIEGLIYAGFDMVDVANNHALDYGREVFEDSLRHLNSAGIDYIGGGFDYNETFAPRIRDIRGTRIGFLGFTYPKIDGSYIPWLPEENMSGIGIVQKSETRKLVQIIKDAKEKCDILIVLFHAGTDYSKKQSEYQEYYARIFLDSGADMMIGHHAHVVQPIEKYKGKWIAYGLGNFVFDQEFERVGPAGLLVVKIKDKKIADVSMINLTIDDDYRPYLP